MYYHNDLDQSKQFQNSNETRHLTWRIFGQDPCVYTVCIDNIGFKTLQLAVRGIVAVAVGFTDL